MATRLKRMKKPHLLPLVAVAAGVSVFTGHLTHTVASAATVTVENQNQRCFIELYEHDYAAVSAAKSEILTDFRQAVVAQNPATEELMGRWVSELENKREDISAKDELAPLLEGTDFSVEDLQAMAALYSNLTVGVATMMNYYSREGGFTPAEAERGLTAIDSATMIADLGYDLSPAAEAATQPAYGAFIADFDRTFAELFTACTKGNAARAEFAPGAGIAGVSSEGSAASSAPQGALSLVLTLSAIGAVLASLASVMMFAPLPHLNLESLISEVSRLL